MNFLIDIGIHEIGHNMGLGHIYEKNTKNYMSYDANRTHFSQQQAGQIISSFRNKELNQGSNFVISGETTNNRLWHNSTNEKPYLFNVNKGDKMPTPIINSNK